MDIIQPTPEEKAAYESQFGPAPLNPIRDFSAQELADLSVADKDHFDIVSAFKGQPDLHADPAIVQKAADALNLVKQRGFKLADLPTPKKAVGGLVETAKGFGKQLWNYANVAGNIVAGAAVEPFSEGMGTAYAEDISKRLASNIAGTEEAMTGLADIGSKIVGKAGRTLGVTKDFSQFTPEEKKNDLWAEVGKHEVQEQRLSGKGAFTSAVTRGESEKMNLDPAEIGTLAAGDPLSFYAFGKGFQAIGAGAKTVAKTVAKAVAPGAVEAVASGLAKAGEKVAKAGEKVVEVAPKVGGGVVQVAGTALEKGGNIVQPLGKVASVAGPIAGAVGLLAGVDPLVAAGKGLIGGTGGVALRRAGKVAADWGKQVSELGKQVSGAVPVKSAYAQGAKDFLQALPGAAGSVAHGAAIDLGLAAATAETPQETEGMATFGTAIGLGKGALRTAGHVISGQLIAPREYGVNKVTPSSGQFKSLDAMHSQALKSASPGVRIRLNAVREFLQGTGAKTDAFLGSDPAAIEKALVESGIPPETAKQWSQQEGFFTASIVGKDGAPRRVVVMNNVEAAPHESFHAVQDVLGESANREIDRIVRDAYADRWEQEGHTYARRLVGDMTGKDWREVILDSSGWGLNEAKEKIYLDIANRIRNETGAEPAPGAVAEQAKAALGQLMDAAVQQNPHLEANEIARHVWREVLSPEEAASVADRYIARELAAENFDAAFKSGATQAPANSLPAKLGRVAGRLITALGGEPLAGRTSEFAKLPLRTPVVEAVTQAVKGAKPGVAPVESKAAPVSKPAVETPKNNQQAAAEEAQKIAAEAPTDIPAGGTASPQELLGRVAEAIASGTGIKINYLSAPGEPAAATTSNRAARREIIEAYRSMPPEARALWEKTFFPDRVIKLKGDKYQVLGWAPEVFAANAHKMAGFLADHSGLSPYAIDATTRTFTPEGWRELYSDVQTFVANQKAGTTGAGEPLVVPKGITDRGFTAPKVTGGEVSLDQTKADFINLLFNFKLPETPRMQKGKMPLNLAGQDVSAATKAGRVEIPVRPREGFGVFGGEEAEAQGIAGRQIMEVNPLRNAIERAAMTAGKEMPSLIEVVQRLNLENIKEVDAAPEAAEFRGNTLTLTAGFQPKAEIKPEHKMSPPEEIRGALDSNAIKFNGIQEGLPPRIPNMWSFEAINPADPKGMTANFMTKEGVPAAEVVKLADAKRAQMKWDTETPTETAQAQPTREELLKKAEDADFHAIRAADNPGISKQLRKIESDQWKGLAKQYREEAKGLPKSTPEFQAQPKPELMNKTPEELFDKVAKFTPDEFMKWVTDEVPKQRYSQVAHDLGINAPNREFVQRLKDEAKSIAEGVEQFKTSGDIAQGMTLANMAQFFREAAEAAEGNGSSGWYLRKYRPGYVAPFPVEGAKAQMQPGKKEFKKGQFWLKGGELHNASQGHEPWVREKFPDESSAVSEKSSEEDRTPNTLHVAEEKGFLRTLVHSNEVHVDGSFRYPDWESVPKGSRQTLEELAFEKNLPVFFDGEEVISKPRPEEASEFLRDQTVQFTPAKTVKGKELEKKGFNLLHVFGDRFEVLKNKELVGQLEYGIEDTSAHVFKVDVEKAFRRQGIAEAMYRELGAELQSKGVTELTGDVVTDGPIQLRDKVFGNTEISGPNRSDETPVSNFIDPLAQFNPSREPGSQMQPKERKITDEAVKAFFGSKEALEEKLQGDTFVLPSYTRMALKELPRELLSKDAMRRGAAISGKELSDRGFKSVSLNWNEYFHDPDFEIVFKKSLPALDSEQEKTPVYDREYPISSLNEILTIGDKELTHRYDAAYKDLHGDETAQFNPNREPGAVKRPAVKREDGSIFEGGTHGEALEKSRKDWIENHMAIGGTAEQSKLPRHTEGFATNNGEFLDRRASRKRAVEMGQISGDGWQPRPGELESVTFESAQEGGSDLSRRMTEAFRPKNQAQPKKDKGYVSGEHWLGNGKLHYADQGHQSWAGEMFDKDMGPEHVDNPPANVYEHVENKGFNRVVTSSEHGIEVDKSVKHPTWGSLPRRNREALEDLAFEKNLPIKFAGKQVLDRPRPDEPAAQFAPAPSADVQKVAEDYAKDAKMPYVTAPNRKYLQPSEETLTKLADFYNSAKHDPTDPAVKESYDALKAETVAQWDAIKAAGYNLEPFTGTGEPYANSSEMLADVRNNKHLFYLPTTDNFSGKENQLMLEKVDGTQVNDIFRAVHDFFGHAKEGYQFGPRGEFNAWKAHSEMYSPEAQGALAAETLAQNAWVNYGPHMRGESKPAMVDRPFAEQKNVVVPAELIDEANAQFAPRKKKGEPEPYSDEWYSALSAKRKAEEASRDADLSKYNVTKVKRKGPDLFIRNPSGFSKAWILPDGKIEQLGGMWHQHWLAEDPDGISAAKKYGIDVPPFEGSEDDVTREAALKKGFIRVNQDLNNGGVTIEALASKWNKRKDDVAELLEKNIDDVASVTVSLLDDAAKKIVDQGHSKLFQFDTAKEKMQHLPLITEGEQRGRPSLASGPQFFEPPTMQSQPNPKRKLEQEGLPGIGAGREYVGNQAVAQMTREELQSHFPEAIVPSPRDMEIPSEVTKSPLYKKAGTEEKAVQAFADRLVEFAKQYRDTPEFQSGAEWYSKFSPELKKAFGPDAHIFAELLAATSPQTAAAVNFNYAFDALRSLRDGRFAKIIPKFEQGLEMLASDKWVGWYNRELKAGNVPKPPAQPTPAAFLETWIAKHDLKPRQSNGALYGTHSIPVLQVFARKWLTESRGPKTLNFVKNLVGTGDEATIDLWADRTMRRVGYDSKPRWRILPANVVGVSAEDFAFGQKAFRSAAEKMGMKPSALQGALWFAEKKLYSERGWGRLDLGDFSAELAKLPQLDAGYKQRTQAGHVQAKEKPAAETGELFVEPRNLRK